MKFIILSACLLGLSQSKSVPPLIREQTLCEFERETGDYNYHPAILHRPLVWPNRPKCNPDGSYFEQQIDRYGKVICVTPWSGTQKWSLSERPCDREMLHTQGEHYMLTDTKCRREAAQVLEEAEQYAKTNTMLRIGNKDAKVCQNDNGLFSVLQLSTSLGFYCVEEETGEYIGKAVWMGDTPLGEERIAQEQSVFAGFFC